MADSGAPARTNGRNSHSADRLANRPFLSNQKKSLNVDSPSFTPAQLAGKKSAFSTNAAPFTPRGATNTSTNTAVQPDAGASEFKPTQFQEFTPQNNYEAPANGSADGGSINYDPFSSMASVTQALPQNTPYNPYAEDHNPLAGPASGYYTGQNAYSAQSQPLQYHLYYPIASTRESLQPYQRQVHDLFIPESVREDLQKKSEAARQVLASQSGVQASLQQYHSLVPLDTKFRNAQSVFGPPTWVWKATSRKNGNIYCLRRIQGFRLTNEEAIKAVNSWKKITHPNIVTTIEAFTTRDFNDSSLIFVHSYHPLSKTLAEHHFTTTRYGRVAPVSERVLWSYLVQLSSALNSIHRAKLAARCVDISKVILTDKNRVRLSACSIFDVLQFDAYRRFEDLQQDDFFDLGKLILSIATNTLPNSMPDLRSLLEQLGRTYSPELKERIAWLLSPQQPSFVKTAEQLVTDIAHHMDDVYIATSNAHDEAINQLGKELENGRVVRMLAKLGAINDRPEHGSEVHFSDMDGRRILKLFQDYVFHQVDAQGNPVVDLGHMISCLNKLDAGIDERIYLTSRDLQNTLVVSYKELKKQVQIAFGDLLKPAAKQPARY
ncbi:Uu.00g109740.m01.CDS01 [Anthostomella pinea]|uniref:PAN2-PAN3 deadenylation complex subunit PAN3 n=1 Tax=Anthostomella pinea TaxID=933095 RepID=A0AAI8VFG2_9PEZI|nr:Uu.00g109740.m01.CDS01 [Anthostomella pinea]